MGVDSAVHSKDMDRRCNGGGGPYRVRRHGEQEKQQEQGTEREKEEEEEGGSRRTCLPKMLPISASGTATLMVVLADSTSTTPTAEASFWKDLSCERCDVRYE